MLSAIQIRRHHFTKVDIECHPDCTERPEQEDLNIELAYSQPEIEISSGMWTMAIDVRFGPGPDGTPVRYRGHLAIRGHFEVHPDFDPAKTDDLVRLNGGSLLFGAVREMILLITSRSTRGPLELATLDARMFLKPEATPETTRPAEKAND